MSVPVGRSASRDESDAHDLATFFDVSLDLLVIRDQDRRFVKVNPAWERTLGYPGSELIGASMLDYIHPDDVAPSQGHMRRMDVEDEVNGFINRYRRRDGTYRHLEWRARRVGDLVYGVARDVTERIAAEAQVAAAKEAAESANRAKSDFLANMSHEIRTPLNGVVGVVAALSRTELTPPQREMVDLIAASGKTLERLLSDVLDVSKIEAGRIELESRVFDLGAEIHGLLSLFRLKAEEKGVGFMVERSPSARGEFRGDSVRLKQILANLLSNAVKFTAEGEVNVALEVVDDTEIPRLQIEVRDTGVGFDSAAAGRLFERFTQADGATTRRFGGTGLGLSITRSLVEMMGGGIEVRSTPGEGSTFRVELPLPREGSLADYDARAACTAAAPARRAPDQALPPNLRILLAEDHPVNRKVVHLLLEPFGVELFAVEDGAAAVEAMAADRFDLVLMDMQMPVMDGLDATRAIRRAEGAGRRTPIVMLSANAFDQHRDQATGAGADGYIAKPVTLDTLISGVREALAGSSAPE